MRFRVELRSTSTEYRAIIREALVIDDVDAIDAAARARQTIAELYDDPQCFWRVLSVTEIMEV